MKTFTGNFKRAAMLSMALLLAAAFFSACPLPELNFGNQNPDFQPRAGAAYIYLSMGNPARTILPDAPVTPIGSYRLTFSDNANGTGNPWSVVTTPTALLLPILMDEVGEFWLVVNAYTSNDASGVAVATSVAQEVEIEPGVNNTPVVVNLILPAPAGTQTEFGTFSYDINLTGVNNTVAGTMVITPVDEGNLPGATLTTDTVNFSSNIAYDDTIIDIVPGYYWVDISLTATINTNAATYNRRHALHIYQQMDSLFEETITAANFILSPFTVTFNHNDTNRPDGSGGTNPTADVVRRVVPNGTVPLPPSPDPFFPNGDQFVFSHWFTTSNNQLTGTPNPPFTAATQVTRTLVPTIGTGMELVVFAHWEAGTPYQRFTINLVGVEDEFATPQGTTTIVHGDQGDVVLTDAGDFTNFAWMVNGTPIAGAGNTSTLAVDTEDPASPFSVYPEEDEHIDYLISVTMYKGATVWSAAVTLRVTRPTGP